MKIECSIMAERERERESWGINEGERAKYLFDSEFGFQVGPINGKNFELSYNSNFSKHSKRWIWIRHETHTEFELIFLELIQMWCTKHNFFVWDPVILDSNHKITIWILCTKRPPNVWFCVFIKLHFQNWWICAFSKGGDG